MKFEYMKDVIWDDRPCLVISATEFLKGKNFKTDEDAFSELNSAGPLESGI